MTSNTNHLSICVVAAVLCAAVIGTTSAHDVPSCASNLVSCLPYWDSTSIPPITCCIPLKMVIENELDCLCSLFNTTSSNGGNVTQAISLATRCGITIDHSACGTAMPPSPAPTGTALPPGTSTSPPPKGLSGTPPPPPSPSSAENIAFASSAGFLGVILFLVSSIILN